MQATSARLVAEALCSRRHITLCMITDPKIISSIRTGGKGTAMIIISDITENRLSTIIFPRSKI